MSAPCFTFGCTHASFPMDEASRVGEARRHAALLANQCSFDPTAAGRLAIVVTELSTNLLRHAHGGRLLMACDGNQVEVIALDKGPGMSNTRQSMGDGFSTAGTSGTGLGAARRQSQEFHLHSVPGEGTVIVARVGPQEGTPRDPATAARVRVGGIATAAPGEVVCGDAWAAAWTGATAALLLADGLGHGPQAHEAARAAVETFGQQPAAQPSTMVQSVHAALRTTRGAAIAALRADVDAAAVEFCGAGNIIGRMISGVTDRMMLTQHGTAGVQVRRPEQVSFEWPDHAALVLHSDGIESRWTPQRLLPVLGRDPVLMAAIVMRDHCRGRDDATVVVLVRANS